jgi:hypothetical protein
MSRSFKKNGWVKDPANRHMKKIAARRLRRIVKMKLLTYTEDSPPLPVMNEVINPYDVCDYKLTTSDLSK